MCQTEKKDLLNPLRGDTLMTSAVGAGRGVPQKQMRVRIILTVTRGRGPTIKKFCGRHLSMASW